MNWPTPASYAEAVLFGISDAIIAASSDAKAKTITYRTSEAANACMAAAAILLNAKLDHGVRPNPDALEKQISNAFRRYLDVLHKIVPEAALGEDHPDFTTHTLI